MIGTAKDYGIKIKGLVRDIAKFKITNKYDIIISYGVLQFLGPKFKAFLTDIKKKTLKDGVNAFYIFGNKGDFYSIAKHRFFFPSEKELKEIYSDWKIIKFEKKNTQLLMKGDKGEILYNLMFKMLAQKR